MAVRIIEISPKISPIPEEKVIAHLSIKNFKWVDELTLQTGVSTLPTMFDWIVNKKGIAYIKKGNDTIPVFGSHSNSGQPYLRCLKDNKWSDEMLELPLIS